MSQDNDRLHLFTRRALVVGGLQLGVFGSLIARLYYLQVIESEKYRTLAEANRISSRLLAPRRGQILDRTGAVLASNDQIFQAILVAELAPDPEETLAAFDQLVPLDDDDKRRIMHDLKHAKSFTPILVSDHLDWGQVSRISLRAPDLPGISIETGYRRTYPFAAGAAPHLIGYVGPASEDESDDAPLLRMPGFRIGKSGVERSYDEDLRGTAGTVQLEVNARGRVVRELARTDPIPGQNLGLSIDLGLQQFVEKRLGQETSAAAVVMDAHTGAVYALASWPGYDPNMFTLGISAADWAKLSGDEAAPLINKAIGGLYAPGSTFKVATALAGLESGLIDPEAHVMCDGHYTLGDHVFHCYKKTGHGMVDMQSAIMQSCDVYFYDLAHKIGIDAIQAMAERLGLGSKSGIDLPGERQGVIPGRQWKRAHSHESWQQGETLNTAIGQGHVLATPLQLASMLARVVNGGLAVTPWLSTTADKDGRRPRPDPFALGINPEHLARVINGMVAVVASPSGTAHGARITEAGYEMGGKSGSAQVRHISQAEHEHGVIPNEALPWRERDNALFIAFAPVGDPRYVTAVIVEHGGSGSKAAAPIARDILLEAQKRKLSAVA